MSLAEDFLALHQRFCTRCGERPPRPSQCGANVLTFLCEECAPLCSRCENNALPGQRYCAECRNESRRAWRAEQPDLTDVLDRLHAVEIRLVRRDMELEAIRAQLDRVTAELARLEKLFRSTPANLARA